MQESSAKMIQSHICLMPNFIDSVHSPDHVAHILIQVYSCQVWEHYAFPMSLPGLSLYLLRQNPWLLTTSMNSKITFIVRWTINLIHLICQEDHYLKSPTDTTGIGIHRSKNLGPCPKRPRNVLNDPYGISELGHTHKDL